MSENTFSYSFADGTLADNYTVATAYGTLTVTNRDAAYQITVKANSDEVKYDGQAHTVDGFETLEYEVDGNTYTVNAVKFTPSAAGTYVARYGDVFKVIKVVVAP
jgi:hypothetical protein